jgi:hypothetical protein
MQGGTNKWKSKDPSVDFAKPVKQGLLGWPKYKSSGGPTTSCGSPQNIQNMLTLIDIGDEHTLLFGNPPKFPGLTAIMDGYG